MTTYDGDERQPGLAAERTDLAWNRSSLALLAYGAALLRGIARPPVTGRDVAAGACVAGLAGVTWALGVWHGRRVARSGERRATAAELAPVAFGVALVGVVALVVAAFLPS